MNAAIKAAHLYISKMPTDIYIPKWDFDAPQSVKDTSAQDSSAAVIVASGLIELIQYLPKNDPSRIVFIQFVKNTMTFLFIHQKTYLDVSTKLAAYLQHGTSFYKMGVKDVGLIYGDYYLFEALNRFIKAKDIFN